MDSVNEYLMAAREIIDSECDSRTPEYRALDNLERAMGGLVGLCERHFKSHSTSDGAVE